jgi:acyl-coenzyme A synthetase/AMP-(fatty) acid ligase
MVTSEETVTFGELQRLAIGAACILREAGVRPNDVVAAGLPSNLNLMFMEALFHEAAIGCIFPGEVDQRNPVKFDWLLAKDYSDRFPKEKTIIVDQQFLRRAAQPITLAPLKYDSLDSVCRLVFSSGTTGSPVAVPFTIREIEGRVAMTERYWMSARPVLVMIGMMGVSGFACAYLSVARGYTYLCPGTTEQNLQVAEREGVVTLKGSAPQLADVIKKAALSPRALKSVTKIISTGSLLNPQLVVDLASLTNAEVVNLYGSTETGTISMQPGGGDDWSDVGSPMDDGELQIVSNDDQPLPDGEVGAIRWRREFQARHYFRNPEASRRAFRGEWFYSGDLGFASADGHLHLVGRASELINAGGVHLNPAKIDAALQASTLVSDAAVFAFDTGGVRGLSVAVVPSPSFDLESFTRLVLRESRGMRPDFVVQVERIPRNAMGKVLREEIANELRRNREKNGAITQ